MSTITNVKNPFGSGQPSTDKLPPMQTVDKPWRIGLRAIVGITSVLAPDLILTDDDRRELIARGRKIEANAASAFLRFVQRELVLPYNTLTPRDLERVQNGILERMDTGEWAPELVDIGDHLHRLGLAIETRQVLWALQR